MQGWWCLFVLLCNGFPFWQCCCRRLWLSIAVEQVHARWSSKFPARVFGVSFGCGDDRVCFARRTALARRKVRV
jgi:hypothetical protein